MTELSREASIREAENLAKTYPDEVWYCIKFRRGFEVVKGSWFQSNTFFAMGEPFPFYNTKTKKVFTPVSGDGFIIDGEIIPREA